VYSNIKVQGEKWQNLKIPVVALWNKTCGCHDVEARKGRHEGRAGQCCKVAGVRKINMGFAGCSGGEGLRTFYD